MSICRTCEAYAYDPIWGEFKCKLRKTRIYGRKSCVDYKKKVEEKENEDILHLGQGSAREGHDGELHARSTGGEG